MKNRIISFLIVMILFVPSLRAQTNNTDFMHSIGKIYVVVAVILAIFAGIILFLIYLDRKISRLEKQFDKNG